MISHLAFQQAALSCIGTPVVHMGRQPGAALDCVGLVWAACRMAGLELAETPTYSAQVDEATLTEGLELFCDRETDHARAHVLQVMHGNQARHVVVTIGANECGQPLIVHAWAKGRVVRRTILDMRVVAGWRIRGVE